MRILLIISLALAFIAAGCGYTLHGKADLPFSEVAIGEIKNKTGEPKLQDRMSRLLAESFMEYGVDVRNSSRYRIEGEFTKFDVYPVAEKDLKAVEYQLTVTGSFRIVDTERPREAGKPGIRSTISKDKKAQYKGAEVDLGVISNPYLTYFRSSGLLVSVLAEKEVSTEKALKDLSREVILRIIYKMPAGAEDGQKKGVHKVEPETVPAGK